MSRLLRTSLFGALVLNILMINAFSSDAEEFPAGDCIGSMQEQFDCDVDVVSLLHRKLVCKIHSYIRNSLQYQAHPRPEEFEEMITALAPGSEARGFYRVRSTPSNDVTELLEIYHWAFERSLLDLAQEEGTDFEVKVLHVDPEPLSFFQKEYALGNEFSCLGECVPQVDRFASFHALLRSDVLERCMVLFSSIAFQALHWKVGATVKHYIEEVYPSIVSASFEPFTRVPARLRGTSYRVMTTDGFEIIFGVNALPVQGLDGVTECTIYFGENDPANTRVRSYYEDLYEFTLRVKAGLLKS